MGTRVFRFVGAITLLSSLAIAGCGVIGASVLDQYWVAEINGELDGLSEDVQSGLSKPGADGVDGADGADGAVGADGTDGADGADGADGDDGADGVDGADGADGADGDDGAAGPAGPQGEQGDPGVLAQAQISAAGTNLSAPNFVTSQRTATGKYRIDVQIRDGFDLTGLNQGDFPVNVTAHPAFLTPNQPAEPLVVAVQAVDFDAVARTLQFTVHIQTLALQPPVYRNADFTFVLMEP